MTDEFLIFYFLRLVQAYGLIDAVRCAVKHADFLIAYGIIIEENGENISKSLSF
jgi:hypothetical protein